MAVVAKVKVLILGGGYAGINCLRRLVGSPESRNCKITVIDNSPWHQIKTRFHERLAYPDRDYLAKMYLSELVKGFGAELKTDFVRAVDPQRRIVAGSKHNYHYDFLVVGLGAEINYLGVVGAAQFSWHTQSYPKVVAAGHALRSLLRQRGRVDLAVCGAGIEGVEVATMLRQALPQSRGRVRLINRNPRILPRSPISENLRAHAVRFCHRQGIDLHLGHAIQEIKPNGVVVNDQLQPADLVFWCGGVRPQPLPGLADSVNIQASLQCLKHPEIFVIGDANLGSKSLPSPASAQKAVFQGELVGSNLVRLLTGRATQNIPYRSKGELIALGDHDGIGIIGRFELKGALVAGIKKLNELRYRWLIRRRSA